MTDFRHLYSIHVKLNTSIPLVRDSIQILGTSEVEVLSLTGLKDAYYTLTLARV